MASVCVCVEIKLILLFLLSAEETLADTQPPLQDGEMKKKKKKKKKIKVKTEPIDPSFEGIFEKFATTNMMTGSQTVPEDAERKPVQVSVELLPVQVCRGVTCEAECRGVTCAGV